MKTLNSLVSHSIATPYIDKHIKYILYYNTHYALYGSAGSLMMGGVWAIWAVFQGILGFSEHCFNCLIVSSLFT